MKKAMTMLTSLFLVLSLSASEEALNAEAVVELQEAIGLGHHADNDDDNGSTFFSVAVTPSTRVLSTSFSRGESSDARGGTLNLANRFFENLEFTLGHRFTNDRGSGLRLQSSFKWMKFRESGFKNSHLEFAPIGVSLDGETTMLGLLGGAYYDFNMIDNHSWDDIIYIGSSVGLVKMSALTGKADLNGPNSRVLQTEAGFLLGLTTQTDLQLGFEYMRIRPTDFIMSNGEAFNLGRFDRYMAKVGILHFFKKR